MRLSTTAQPASGGIAKASSNGMSLDTFTRSLVPFDQASIVP
jgi:hypothetical protein